MSAAAAIVPAAGLSKRMAGLSKLFIKFNGAPLLALTLKNLSRSKMVSSIILIVNKRDLKRARALVKRYRLEKVKEIVIGGRKRTDSVRRGLMALGESNGAADFVLIHDGARPFVDDKIISRTISAALKTGAAVAGVPEKCTVKRLSKKNFVSCTLKRDELWQIQTPQVFRRDLILRAMAAGDGEVTDDATLVERLGEKVKVVLGSYKNIKITTPEDLVIARAFLRSEKRKAKSEKLQCKA